MTPQEIRTTRATLGMTQAQFAKAIGCALSTLTRWEQLKTEDPVVMLAPYAASLAKLKRKADKMVYDPTHPANHERVRKPKEATK